MGSHATKDNSSEQSKIHKNSVITNKQTYSTISSLTNNNSENENSSYNGINFDKMKTKSKNNNYNSDHITQEKSISETQNKNLIKFYWNEGGKEVFITGSFLEWNKRLKMHKNKNNIFEVELFLPKGKYEFKFIIDGSWRCSSNYQQIKDDRGNNNNFIDNISVNNNFNEINFNLNKNVSNLSEENNHKMRNIDELKKNYSNIYPSIDQLSEEAPKIPDVLEISIDLTENSNQKNIGNEQYLDFSYINLDESFKNILQPVHSYLNHIFTNNDKSIIYNSHKEETENSTYLGINCNVKVKNKCISIIYYSPLSKI
jgi:hypothetical protein